MAGTKGRSGGRNIKPDTVRLADGTWSKSANGDPAAILNAEGVPIRPEFLNRSAEELWESTFALLTKMGIVKEIDTSLLQSMCEMWGLYRDAYSVAVERPIDKDARIAVTTYWAKFEVAAARFGMNPCDRSRLRIDKPKEGVRTRQA